MGTMENHVFGSNMAAITCTLKHDTTLFRLLVGLSEPFSPVLMVYLPKSGSYKHNWINPKETKEDTFS